MTLEFRKAPLKNLMEEPTSFTPNNFVLFNPNGDAADSGFSLDGLSASIVSKAAAGLTQLGTWNATTNLTDAGATLPSVPVDAVGSFYDVTTAGTRFSIAWAVNDKILVAQKPDGTKVWTKQAATGDLFDPANVYASSGTGSDANSGTLLRPKKTLSSAISVVSQPGTIILSAGAYGTLGNTLAIAKQNVLIVGRGANSSNQCTLSDNLTLNAARFRLRDVNVAGTVTWTDTTGGHQLLGVGGLTNFMFSAASTARGFSIIADSDLSGSTATSNIDLADLPAGQTASLYLTRTTNARAKIGAGWVVYVTDCKDFQCTSINATGTLLSTDDLPYVAFLTTQAELDAAKAAATIPSLGYYIIDFNGATGVGDVARGDVLYKRAPSLMSLHKKYAYAPPSIYGPNGRTHVKKDGGWIEVVTPSSIPSSAQVYTSTMSIKGTTSNPSLGAATVNYITLIDDGSGWCEVVGEYNGIGAGLDGSGTYLYELPAAWVGSIDQNTHPFNTQVTTLSGQAEIHKIIPGGSGIISRSDGATQYQLVVPHSARQFKLLGAFSMGGTPSWYWYQNSVYFQLSGILHMQFRFKFKKA